MAHNWHTDVALETFLHFFAQQAEKNTRVEFGIFQPRDISCKNVVKFTYKTCHLKGMIGVQILSYMQGMEERERD